jgi:1-pyrroline-5-carboxylate dehydrogenase
MSFKLTYATMFNPPEALHAGFDAALAGVEARLGARHGLLIDGSDVAPAGHAALRGPIDRERVLGEFAVAGAAQAEAAMRAAQAAYASWRATPYQERARLLRKVADLLEQRVYEISAALALEVGKNRMEALGETAETVDFFRHYADDMERHGGFDHPLPNDPLPGVVSTNRSVMRPYGVWVVIVPFNYPLALAGGPVAAALVAGNTVVLKGSENTPWSGRLLADCIRDAGLPKGVFNYLSGAGGDVGAALAAHPLTAGLTFTGSVAVGKQLIATLTGGAWPRPVIAEMGGKNPCIVTARADLDAAAAGIARSAYGMGGQKCSALSRLYVETSVADALIERLKKQIAAIRIGDPTKREHWLGPVIHAESYGNFSRYVEELKVGGATIHAGGRTLTDGALARGYYVEPTLAEAPPSHRLWRHEMFVPLLMLQRVKDRKEAMRLANDTQMGLTAGFYGGADEVPWFHEHIEAGVTYANRPQGATTGAWPGYQPFGGWKGSGSTGKAIASYYYLPLYLREQSRTVVE